MNCLPILSFVICLPISSILSKCETHVSQVTTLLLALRSLILECPDLDLPYLENGWHKSLRLFLCSINATMHVASMERVPQTLQEKDQSIMGTFVQMQHCNSTKLY
jgi:hypothetical protein